MSDLIEAVARRLVVDRSAAARIVHLAEPLWDELERHGFCDGFAGRECARVLPTALATIVREANRPSPGIDLTNVTWTCHVCGGERPDAKISVVKFTFKVAFVTVTYNVRYCNDRLACAAGAEAVAEGWAGRLAGR